MARVYDLRWFEILLCSSNLRSCWGRRVPASISARGINHGDTACARINMFLHTTSTSQASTSRWDTLTEPAHGDNQPFDAIVSGNRRD